MLLNVTKTQFLRQLHYHFRTKFKTNVNFVFKVTVSLSTNNESGGIFIHQTMDGWLYKRKGEYLETIQRFITQLSDSGNISKVWFS